MILARCEVAVLIKCERHVRDSQAASGSLGSAAMISAIAALNRPCCPIPGNGTANRWAVLPA